MLSITVQSGSGAGTWTGIALAAGVVVAFLSYLSTVRNSLAQQLRDRYYAVLQLEQDHPRFVNSRLTADYEQQFRADADRLAYESFARLCWSHAQDILDAHFIKVFFRRRFIKQYCNAFETYRNLHYTWLERNRPSIPNKRFHRFIDRCRWRDYVSPRTADELRWFYTDAFEGHAYLDPLNALPDRIGMHIDSLTRQGRGRMRVADVGCGTGELLVRLGRAGFQDVVGLDYSRKMVAKAEERVRWRCRTAVQRADMLHLERFHRSFDRVFSTNSILPREPADTPVILRQLAGSLKDDGQLVAIIPAFDTIVDLKRFELPLYRRDRRRYHRITGGWILGSVYARLDRWRAFRVDERMSGWFGNTLGRWRAVRLIVRRLLVRPTGPHQFADDGANIQRFLRKREIKRHFRHAGLRLVIGPEPVWYTWDDALKQNYGHFQLADYREADRIFDWFVVAERRHPTNG